MSNSQHRLLPLTLCLVSCWIGTVAAQSPPNSDSTSTAATSKPTPGSIEQLSWIAGHWQGEAMGGKFEETWNPPFAGAMMGMFKFAENDKVVFYELLTIVPSGDSLMLRLKHFNPELVGWEDKAETVDFPLIKIDKNIVAFDGLTFRRVNRNTMHITVRTKTDDEIGQLKFECHRVRKSKADQDSPARADNATPEKN